MNSFMMLPMRYWKRLARSASFMLVLVSIAIAFPQSASAHGLHDTSINRYSLLEIGAAGIHIHYALSFDMSLTYQEPVLLDANRDGKVSLVEQQAYLRYKIAALQPNLHLFINSVAIPLQCVHQTLSFPPDRGGIHIIYITADFVTKPLAKNANTLLYQDMNFQDRDGWKEMVVRNATGAALLSSDAPATDQSNALLTYPKRLFVIPPTQTTAHATFRLDPHVVVKNVAVSVVSNDAAYLQDPLTILINVNQVTWQIVLLALVVAVVLGALHALSPGHGKTVVGGYLVGTRGTPRHAAFLGAVVTVTHTLGVYVLGLVALAISHVFLPEQLYPWLDLISSLSVLLMGGYLLYSRMGFPRIGHRHTHKYDEHGSLAHEHEHEHTHEEVLTGHPKGEIQLQNHVHAHVHVHDGHEHTHESMVHAHVHVHDGHEHTHENTAYVHEHHVSEEDGSLHTHGAIAHTHLPPGADGRTLTWRGLLLFGISAGLTPCPSALIVMLSAIALHRVGFGLVLIVFFSLGLAAMLIAIGFLFIYAQAFLSAWTRRFPGQATLVRLLPAISAVVVMLIGWSMAYTALVQLGFV